MYHHSNASGASTGSARRISSNNPFRSALLQEEQRSRSRHGSNPPQDDQQYNAWLARRIQEEEKEEPDRGYSSDDSFEAGDELDFIKQRPPKPITQTNFSRHSSTNSRKGSTNPFSKPDFTTDKQETAAPPPAYYDVVPKSKQKDYPRDEKSPSVNVRSEEVDDNPFPENLRPAPPAPSRSNGSHGRLNAETMTNTTTTKIYSDGRVRSKSTGDPMAAALGNRHRSQRRPEGSSSRHQSSSNKDSDRPHRSHSHSHGGHRSSNRKRFIHEKSRNVDTIDKMDVTGFFGGAKFHHDGPFDACTPRRNKDIKAAPVAAFPADGPNNSIRGIEPNYTKEDQYDMMFGNANPDGQNIEGEVYKTKSHPVNSDYREGSVDTVAGALGKARISQFDVTNTKQLHGEESLGLGSSTFMDGAPVHGKAAQVNKENESGLGRKKTILGRMKTIVRK